MATTDTVGTSTQGLAPWAAPYVTDTLALGKAAASEPIENTIYGGPLTAGASALQNKVFQGIGGLNFPSNLGGTFSAAGTPAVPQVTGTGLSTGTTGTGGGITGLPSTGGIGGMSTTSVTGGVSPEIGTNGGVNGGGSMLPSNYGGGTNNLAESYMNPYLQNVLNPQLQALRQNAQSNLNAQMGKLTSQGAYGGGRQAVITGAANRDLLQELNKTLGTGYSTAFDKARDQFNTEQKQGLDLGNFMAAQGKTQRDIESEGVAADLKEFERQRDYYKNNAKYMRDLIGPGTLPIQETVNTPAELSGIAALISSAGGAKALLDLFKGANADYTMQDLMSDLGFGG